VKTNSRSSIRTGLLIASGPVLGCLPFAQPALAQAPRPADDTIVVIGARPIFDVAPERSLDEADVESYGLGSVGEVLDEIAAESGDSREDPVFLVNGKRVNGLGDVEDLPAEAISRVEVIPAGGGSKVGARAGQRVYNISLRKNLDLVAARAGVRVATRGAWSSRRGDVSYTHIRGERRVSLAVKARDDDTLLESERGVVQSAGAIADAGSFRSLVPDSDRLDFSLSASDQLAPWLTGSLSAKLATSRQTSLLGAFAPAGTAERAFEQRSRAWSASVDAAFNAAAGSWLFSALGNYSYDRRRTLTDRLDPAGLQLATSTRISRAETLGGLLTASGPLFELPAGPLQLTASAGISRDTIGGERSFLGTTTFNSTSQTTTTLSGGLTIPLASRSKGFLPFLGDLSASAEFTRTHVSQFGSFTTRTFGFTWRPADWIRLNGSISRGNSAPSVALIDEPLLETPGVSYFDPLRNETVLVTRITGGVPGLLAQSTRTSRLGANIKPIRSLGLRLTAEFLETSNRNVATGLPPASAAVIAAFPDRFIRDGSGRLIAVDERAVVLASRDQRQLRLGLNLNLPLGSGRGPAAAADDDDEAGAPEQEPARRGVRPRLQINASHTWLLGSKLTIRPGDPTIDLLSPGAIGLGGLGQPRHRFDLGLGYAERGFGVRLNLQHRSASFLEAGGATANVLRFAPLTTFGLRAWVQGSRLFPNSSLAKGTRFTILVQNLGDVRERVTDSFGVTPLAYQPAYREPIGRTIELQLRKTF
jgi:hypothetical protein